jgi:two-component SAPR family response regulator
MRSSERAETPIVAMTAYKDEVQRDLFDFTIIKPFRNEDLTRIIGSLEHANSREAVQVPGAIHQTSIEPFSNLRKE